MAQLSKIEWTDKTWNFLRGCSRVSEGCRNCYAERQAIRHAYVGGPYHELVRSTPAGPRWTGKVEFFEHVLVQPLSWKKPAKIFVNSMSDLFHEDVKDEWLDMAFAVMALTPQHTYQILTKRPERMREWMKSRGSWPLVTMMDALYLASGIKKYPVNIGHIEWPLKNVWLGTSVEDRVTYERRVLHLANTPAALRFVSLEPLLGDLGDLMLDGIYENAFQWAIIGGESGPNARSFDISWARSIVDQCRFAGMLVFVKQLGADPIDWRHDVPEAPPYEFKFDLSDRKGGNPDDWPEDLRIRQMPEVANV